MKRLRLYTALLMLGLWVRTASVAGPLDWPGVTKECRPWTRWWWLGSAVDRENLTRLLEEYQKARFGGVEICPIYGAKGYEARYIEFLSPKWMEMLGHTTAEAKRLGMGVDMTDGTGWPFGGPWVSAEDASSKVVLKRYEVAGGSALKEALPKGRLQCLMAVSDAGATANLAENVRGDRVAWTAPAGKWRVYAVVQQGPVQKVKRAAPGGEGNVVDPYSVEALDKYLARFDRAFVGFADPMPRGHFHDSFEYYGASWTIDFIEQFQKRRGYDLQTQLPALFGDGPADTVARVKHDYRETLGDLHLEYVDAWTKWCNHHNGLSRDQAHGAPGNLIDLYAAADIPETEIFARFEEKHMPMLKFSSSAAHLAGTGMASSESFTWLGEHFQVSLADLKPAADFLMLSGVNHMFYHGVPYSPEDVPWPGWLFYAAVNFGPNGGLWHDLPAFNAYVTRCQSVLQAGTPANDVLLYFPVHDYWQKPEGLVTLFTTPGKWMEGTTFHEAAMALWERGYGFDEVSDRLLDGAKAEGGKVGLGSGYRVVVVPRVKFMPVGTWRKLMELADAGVTVVVQGEVPKDVPGLGALEQRRKELRELAGARARVIVGEDLDEMLRRAGVKREPMVDAGLRFVRRSRPGGYSYYIVNRSEKALDGWVTLGTGATSAVILDPMFEDRSGIAALWQARDGHAEVYLQLVPGGSVVVRTFADRRIAGRKWDYIRAAGEGREVAGTWHVHFVEGGPVLPGDFDTTSLGSWTNREDAEAKRFAGTARYSIEFERQAGAADDWWLDLGRVCESARVRINGKDVATLWRPPFRVRVGTLLRDGKNTLEVEVTNLAANRIADLDRRGVQWKSFHEINFVNRDYKPFDASMWPLRDSGLVGPVRLMPLSVLKPE